MNPLHPYTLSSYNNRLRSEIRLQSFVRVQEGREDSWGFLLLGVSLFLQAGTENIVAATAIDALRVRGEELVAFLVYTALQLIAYAIFA